VALLHSAKPIVTGTFTKDGFAVMKEMLTAVAGDETGLRGFPMAVFDVCPSAPLKWSDLGAQCLIECARSGIPVEIVSAPLAGASAPITLAGVLVQHAAENLSGVVTCRLAAEDSPVIYGGAPAVFDMRHGTAATGAVETALVTCACAQIGRFLGLPTHGYVGLSDAKTINAQAGLESGIGAMVASLAGINVVSGAGMLEFESCQSLEKLVIDDEICGMARRLVAGIQPRAETLAEDLFGDLSQGDRFLTSPLTLRWLREETRVPSAVIDRRQREAWHNDGAPNAVEQAHRRAADLLARHRPEPLPDDVRARLTDIMSRDARRLGIEHAVRI
jgi:trimethylamine--corrinoid protein Co-methyltransferase